PVPVRYGADTMPRVTTRHPTALAGEDPEPLWPKECRPERTVGDDSARRPSHNADSSTRRGVAQLRATMRAETLRRRTRPTRAIAPRSTPEPVRHPERGERVPPAALDRAGRATGPDTEPRVT